MNDITKKLIREKLAAIYALTDEILNLVNKDGKTILRYPFGYEQAEIEEAIFDYIDSRASK